MRLATNYERIHQAGAELIAVSVDDDGRQAGMARRWGLTHTRLVSDPGGESILVPIGLFDPEERGGIALPGMLILGPDGREHYRYQGRDFADRTNDEDLFEALATLSLDPVSPSPWAPAGEPPADLRGYFRPSDLPAYFRGNMFAAVAIGGRATDRENRALAREHRVMARATLDAWDEWKATVSES